jgi:hypothetical protein
MTVLQLTGIMQLLMFLSLALGGAGPMALLMLGHQRQYVCILECSRFLRGGGGLRTAHVASRLYLAVSVQQE